MYLCVYIYIYMSIYLYLYVFVYLYICYISIYNNLFINIYVYLDGPEVKITKSSPLRNLEEGSTVSLNCVVDSNPSSSIIWYRDGSGEIVSRTTGFELLRVEREQAGRYFCQAYNTLGSSIPKSVDIDVLCKY